MADIDSIIATRGASEKMEPAIQPPCRRVTRICLPPKPSITRADGKALFDPDDWRGFWAAQSLSDKEVAYV
jgi:hypothetical protein